MSKKYTVDYFLKKFRAIPPSGWGEVLLFNYHSGSKCALGHCGVGNSNNLTPEATALVKLCKTLYTPYQIDQMDSTEPVWSLNDGGKQARKQFPQKTPRGRMLAALRLIKRRQVKTARRAA